MNKIEQIILDNIHNKEPETVFVFPTQLAADLWADRIVMTSDVKAVPMERFIAWDVFKRRAVSASVSGKESIPAVLRTIFASSIIEKNASEKNFKRIIPPQYSEEAGSFTNWIASFLPSLSSWNEKFLLSGQTRDEEDEDFLYLYQSYNDFLESHKLFDPAWQRPPFTPDGNKYIIFYPEILTDYCEYETILTSTEASQFITLIHVDSDCSESTCLPPCHLFTNSRGEIKSLALYLRDLHGKDGISWRDIAVSVPDLETLSPYITREFKLQSIPFVEKNGRPLTSFSAGSLFTQLQNCVSSDFSFESLKNLLMNTQLPWLEPSLNDELIQFGKENNCICSFEYQEKKVDVWKKSFEETMSANTYRLYNYYSNLYELATNVVKAKTFREINKNYFIFREKMFDMEHCSTECDNVISRCLITLAAFIDIEAAYPDCIASDPYSLFTAELEKTNYVTNSKETGVAILPYKTGAVTPFAIHCVVNVGENVATVINKQLSFLRDDKRKKLGLFEQNISMKYFYLYATNSLFSDTMSPKNKQALFSCSTKTFTGYALPHCSLNVIEQPTDTIPNVNDTYETEKNWFLDESNTFPKSIKSVQSLGVNNWILNQRKIDFKKKKTTPNSTSANDNSSGDKSVVTSSDAPLVDENASDFLKALKETDFFDKEKKRYCISQTALKNFYNCPRIWLYNKLFKIDEEVNEAELMNPFTVGNLYHKILECFCLALKDAGKPIPSLTQSGELPQEMIKVFEKASEKAFKEIRVSPLSRQLIYTESEAINEKALEAVTAFCDHFKSHIVIDMEKPLSFEPDGEKYFYYGRPDCILSSDDGGLVLVDFKTSDSQFKDTNYFANEPNDIPDFQIPLYVSLIEKEMNAKVEKACFFAINQCSVKEVISPDATAEEVNERQTRLQFEKTIEATKKFAQGFIEKVEHGIFLVDKKKQNFYVCNDCKFRSVCRRAFTISGEED